MKFPKNTGFTDEKHEADDDPPTLSPSISIWYTFKRSPCMPAPRAHVENTCARGAGIHGVFSVSHTHTTPHTTTTTRPPHHTETDTERETKREEETKEKKDKRIEKRREKREDPFSVWWCMAVFSDGVILRLIPFAHET